MVKKRRHNNAKVMIQMFKKRSAKFFLNKGIDKGDIFCYL